MNEAAPAESPASDAPQSSPASPPLKPVSAWLKYVLTLAWCAIAAGYLSLADFGLRPEFDGPLVLTLGALAVSLPIAWFALSAWRNRVGFGTWSAGRCALQVWHLAVPPLLCLAAIGVMAFIVLPTFHPVVASLMNLSPLYLTSSSLLTSVIEKARANKTLVDAGAELAVTPDASIAAGLVGRDGVVLLYSNAVRALAVIIPEMKGEEVKWSCDSMPKMVWPSACREGQPATSYAQRFSGSPAEDAAELLKRASVWKKQVTDAVIARSSLERSAKTVVIRREGLVDFGLLDSNGRIALYSDRHGTFVLLDPSLKDAQITWRCRVWPAKAAPKGCEPTPMRAMNSLPQ